MPRKLKKMEKNMEKVEKTGHKSKVPCYMPLVSSKPLVSVKICGLRRMEDIRIANEFLPDYIGFVFAPSKRQVSKEQAEELKAALDPRIQAVGVFVNQKMDWICELAEQNVIDVIQLHGQESEETVREIRRRTGKSVIKMLHVEDLREARLYPEADFLLIDNGAGGTGEKFEWEQARELLQQLTQAGRRWFLAGGIGLHNVKQAIRLEPYGIDVSSLVETEGYKDREKVRLLIEAVNKEMEEQ